MKQTLNGFESKRHEDLDSGSDAPLEPGQYKPKNEGINNTDTPGASSAKKALNNPTHQDEGLSSGGEDPLADL